MFSCCHGFPSCVGRQYMRPSPNNFTCAHFCCKCLYRLNMGVQCDEKMLVYAHEKLAQFALQTKSFLYLDRKKPETVHQSSTSENLKKVVLKNICWLISYAHMLRLKSNHKKQDEIIHHIPSPSTHRSRRTSETPMR